MDSEDGRVHSNNPQFVVRGFSHSRISLALYGISIEEDSDEDISDDYGEDDDDEEDDTSMKDEDDEEDNDDKEVDEEEDASHEDKHSDEELYIEGGSELRDSYQVITVIMHPYCKVIDNED